MMILFYLVLLFCKRNYLDGILYIFFPPIILLGRIIFFMLYVFSLDFILDRIHFYVIPVIGLIFILNYISIFLGIFFSCYVRTVCFIQPYDVTAYYDVSCVYLTNGMYRQYGFAHNLVTCSSFLYLPAFILH